MQNIIISISLIVLFFALVLGCQDNNTVTKNTEDHKQIIRQKQATAEKEANDRFQKELNRLVDLQIQKQQEEKERNDREVQDARAKIAELERQAKIRDLESEKRSKEIQLQEAKIRFDTLEQQKRENAEKIKRSSNQ